MENARRQSAMRQPDYDRALAAVEEALKIKPDDPEALSLKTTLESGRKTRDEKASADEREREAQHKALALDARRRALAGEFRKITQQAQHDNLFETHSRMYKTDLAKVRAALLKTCESGPTHLPLETERTVSEDTVILECRQKGGLLKGERRCMLLLCEVSPGETHLYAKFWDYGPPKEVKLSLTRGVEADNFVPIHRQFFPPEQADEIDKRRRELPEKFFAYLETQL